MSNEKRSPLKDKSRESDSRFAAALMESVDILGQERVPFRRAGFGGEVHARRRSMAQAHSRRSRRPDDSLLAVRRLGATGGQVGNLPPPEVIAQEIVDDPEAALE